MRCSKLVSKVPNVLDQMVPADRVHVGTQAQSSCGIYCVSLMLTWMNWMKRFSHYLKTLYKCEKSEQRENKIQEKIEALDVEVEKKDK